MQDWEWEKGDVLKGSGKVLKKGFIVKFQYIDELGFRVKGRLSTASKGTEKTKDIFYFKMGVEEIGLRHLPVSMVDIITNALWEINIDHVKKAQVNGKALKKQDIVQDMAKRIKNGETVKKVYVKFLGKNQTAEVNLDIRKKKDVRGEIEFKAPVPKREVDRFGRDLQELLPLFKKDEKKGKRKERDKEENSPPLEYGGPGQEPVKWYGVHGRG